MQALEGRRILVTGGNRGLGLGIVEALVERQARVTVLARDTKLLEEVQQRLGVEVITADATDKAMAEAVLRELRPEFLFLNAGATPVMAPLHEQTWEQFTSTWDNDVKATLHWVQAALRLPLARGSRVLITSSGAAIGGSPLSGGYSGAKRMQWLMANYANGMAAELDLGIRFQVLVPQQMIGTNLGRTAAEAYARRKGITADAFLASFGKPMSPRQFGEYAATILTDPAYASGTAFGLKGETGIQPLNN